LFISDNHSSLGNRDFIIPILKYYYEPLAKELTKYDFERCFNTSLFLVKMHGIDEIKSYSEESEALYTAVDDKVISEDWYSSIENDYWKNLSRMLDDLVRRKKGKRQETFVFFLRYFPETFLDKLYELQYKSHIDVVVVFHDSVFSSFVNDDVSSYGNGRFEKLPHVIASSVYHNNLRKSLLDAIRNPKMNWFDFIRNVESSTNTSCLKNTTIGVIYKVVDRMPYYENWFVELMIRLENILVVKNKEMNVKFHFFIIGTIYFNLPKMVYNYEITKIKVISDLYTWHGTGGGKEKKIFLTTFLEEHDNVFEALNSILAKYNVAGLIARVNVNHRDLVINHKYRALFRQNNIVDVNIDESSSDDTINLLVEALILAGC